MIDASCTLLFLLVEGKERIRAWGWEGGYSVRNVMSDNFLIPQISISVLLRNVTWHYDHNGNWKFFGKLTKIFRKGHLFWTDENVSERDPKLHCWTKLQFNWKLEKQTNTPSPLWEDTLARHGATMQPFTNTTFWTNHERTPFLSEDTGEASQGVRLLEVRLYRLNSWVCWNKRR